MKLLDTDHPFFRPLWVRVAIVLVSAGWAVFEFATGAPFWGILFAAFCTVSVWGFFFDFNPDRNTDNTPNEE